MNDRLQLDKVITIVSGLPRSGTSMMMKMLEAGGLPPLTDNIRSADDDNPKGYYEFERVKKLPKGDTAWLQDASGKAVKIIAALLTHLPDDHIYKVVFMRRAMSEILASQREMLVRRGENPDKFSDGDLSELFENHIQKINVWIEKHSNIQRIEVNYNDVLENPKLHIATINQFLGGTLDEEKMNAVIDPSLHRQRE